MRKVYLDYAAATPMSPEVLESMQLYFSQTFYNPSAIYSAGRQARQALDDARAKIAQVVGAKPAEIIFTSGATEANNLAIAGLRGSFPKSQIMVSAIEHESILAPAKAAKAVVIPVLSNGEVDLDWLAKKINPSTVLISVIMVSNEIGTLQQLRQISQMIDQQRKQRLKNRSKLPIYLHTDATQAANFFDLHVSRLGVDLMSINGGKIYGPKQTGLLYVKAGVKLTPLILGGGQEFSLRSGTENVPGVIGLATALEIAQENRLKEADRLEKLRQEFIKKLFNFDRVHINGTSKHQSPHIISASFVGHDNERLMYQLDELGISCAVGSACSASSQEPSHVLSAIGLDKKTAQATLRFSLGKSTSSKDIAATVEALAKII